MQRTISTTGVLAYRVSYVPKRARKVRQAWVTEEVAGDVQIVSFAEAPVAFRVSEQDGRSFELRAFGGELFARVSRQEQCGGPIVEPTLTNLIDPSPNQLADARLRYGLVEFGAPWYYGEPRRDSLSVREWVGDDRSKALSVFEDFCRDHLVLEDGAVWSSTGEPRYVIQTFGLGNNHGGTAVFIAQHYNGNIPSKRYFRADQREAAMAAAEVIAARRGDTRDVPMRSPGTIDVLMPQMVRLNPASDHGEGDPFINQLEAATEHAGSITGAGFGVLAVLARSEKR